MIPWSVCHLNSTRLSVSPFQFENLSKTGSNEKKMRQTFSFFFRVDGFMLDDTMRNVIWLLNNRLRLMLWNRMREKSKSQQETYQTLSIIFAHIPWCVVAMKIGIVVDLLSIWFTFCLNGSKTCNKNSQTMQSLIHSNVHFRSTVSLQLLLLIAQANFISFHNSCYTFYLTLVFYYWPPNKFNFWAVQIIYDFIYCFGCKFFFYSHRLHFTYSNIIIFFHRPRRSAVDYAHLLHSIHSMIIKPSLLHISIFFTMFTAKEENWGFTIQKLAQVAFGITRISISNSDKNSESFALDNFNIFLRDFCE